MNNEKIYDEQIAPKLLEIANLCKDHGIPFIAVVEWADGKIGRTDLQTKDECLEMIMIRHCAKTAPNVDSYIIGLLRHAKELNIDTSQSMVLRTLIR